MNVIAGVMKHFSGGEKTYFDVKYFFRHVFGLKQEINDQLKQGHQIKTILLFYEDLRGTVNSEL